MQPRLNIEPIAEEVAELIVNGSEDPRVKWYPDRSVWIKIGNVIPKASGVKRTVEGRRRRFRDCLRKKLSDRGWHEIRSGVYSPRPIE